MGEKGELLMKLKVVKLGRIEYGEALKLQERLVELRQQDAAGNTLLLLEHPPVLTSGVRGQTSNILLSDEDMKTMGVRVFDINRGGDVTYHGPGQIVGYPIINISDEGMDIKTFIYKIEEVFIRLLKNEYGIEADREDKKYTGVWVGDEKITAIGIAVKKWVTMHGFAFNVNTDLSHFKWIVPCGINDRGVTSLQKLTGRTAELEDIYSYVARYFEEVFEAEAEDMSVEELKALLSGA